MNVQDASFQTPEQVQPISTQSAQPHSPTRSRWWQSVWVVRALLVVILLLGAHFRTISLFTWDNNTGQHPDERFFTDVTSSIRLPTNIETYFDSARSLSNPRNIGKNFYVYGTFPPMVTRVVAVALTPEEKLPQTVPDMSEARVGSNTPLPQIPNPELKLPTLPEPFLSFFNPDHENLTGYPTVNRAGRSLAVLFDLGSILLLYFIGKRLYGRKVGLLSALFGSLTVFAIQQSHFYVDPTFSTFFVTFGLYWLVRLGQGGGIGSATAFGIGVGAAMANRISLALLGPIGLVAVAMAAIVIRDRIRDTRDTSGNDIDPSTSQSSKKLAKSAENPSALTIFATRGLPLIFWAGFITLLTFRIMQPYAFVGSAPDSPSIPGHTIPALNGLHGSGFLDIRLDPRFVENMKEIESFVTGERDFFPSQQWVQRTPHLFPFKNMVLWGMGPFLGIVAWLGWVVIGVWHARFWVLGKEPHDYDTPQGRFRVNQTLVSLALWVWVGFYFYWQGGQFAKNMRYMLPISGVLTVFGAWLLIHGIRSIAHRPQPLSSTRDLGWAKWLPKLSPTFLRTASQWALVVVVIGTFAWAYAFTRIYTRPHSRVMAARWVLQHVPPGSTITYESWDDPLPLQVDGGNPWGTIYKGIQTNPYWQDDPAKFLGREPTSDPNEMGLLDQLANADYVALTSNRIYASTNRLPMRYPATMRYYHYLFTGELGFELVADVASYPSLLGFPIPDQGAEEAFTVYDHPRVLVFRKTPAFSYERAKQLLMADVNWDEVYTLPVQVADKAPTGLRLTESEWPAYRNHGTWSNFFDPQSIVASPFFAPIVWLLVVEFLGLGTFLLLFRVLPWLPDRGFSVARPIGIIFVAAMAWLLGSFKIAPFTPTTVRILAVGLVVIGVGAAWFSRREIVTFLRQRFRTLLMVETLYLAAFVLFLAIRWLNPDLWHPARGGEKMMELAYLNAVLKSPFFPPYDPWYAGGYINYYYFGYVLIGTIIHLTGIVPDIAFNLAVPMLFALTAVGAWGVVYNLLAPRHGRTLIRHDFSLLRKDRERTRRAAMWHVHIPALLAPVLMLLLGNIVQGIWHINGYVDQQAHRPEWAYWDATRIIEGTVNEFPFFTFLFADMHPHMIVMPFSLALLGLIVAVVRLASSYHGSYHHVSPLHHGVRAVVSRIIRTFFLFPYPSYIALLALMGVVAGTLRVTNTWDYPTYVGLALLVFTIIHYRSYQRMVWEGETMRGSPFLRHLVSFAISAVFVVGLGNLLYHPFTSHFATSSSGIELWRDERYPSLLMQMMGAPHTTSRELFFLYGLWLTITIWAALAILTRWFQARPWVVGAAFGAIVGAVVISLRLNVAAPLILFPLLIGAVALVWSVRMLPLRKVFPMWWIVGALAIVLGVELIAVKGDVGRMNTVFKFGLHAWMLFALAAAIALPWLVRTTLRDLLLRNDKLLTSSVVNTAISFVFGAMTIALLASSAIYPLTATPARIADRATPDTLHTLDGLAFLRYAEGNENATAFPLSEDGQAIAWMRQHITGTPIILEGHLPSYRWAGRVSSYTGLPTVLGWHWHQVQQRSIIGGPFVDRRKDTVKHIYNTPNPQEAMREIRAWGVEYLYVGQTEQAIYSDEGIEKFGQLVEQGELTPAFQAGQTTVFQVENPGEPTMLTTDLPVEPPHTKTIPPLLLDQPVNELPAVDEHGWNSGANKSSWHALLVWLFMLFGLTLLGLPLGLFIFRGWVDSGVPWSRLLALILVGYLVWLPTSFGFWHYANISIIVAIFAVMVLDGFIVVHMGIERVLIQLWRGLKHLAVGEMVFFGGLLFFILVRSLNPDLWHPIWGGEKPMEFGFLNAILRSPVMPPYDPFFSDGYINYYYYGLYLVSLPIKFTGIAPAYGFNLVLATLFGLCASGVYSIVAHLTRRARYGLIGVVFLVLMGNVATFVKVGWSQGIDPVLRILFEEQDGSFFGRLFTLGERLGDWYIGPSRVITSPSFTINEFPYWSFLYGDLHPHLIALPITLLMIALVYRFVAGETPSPHGHHRKQLLDYLPWVFTALTLGTLAVTNSWDFPTYSLLLGVALVGAAWRAHTSPLPLSLRVGRAAFLAVVLAFGGLLLYAPFFEHFYAFVSGVGLVKDGTILSDYAVVYGLFLVILLPSLFGATWVQLARYPFWRWRSSPLSIQRGLLEPTPPPQPLPTPSTASAEHAKAVEAADGGEQPNLKGHLVLATPSFAILGYLLYALLPSMRGLFKRSERSERSGRISSGVTLLGYGSFVALLTPLLSEVQRQYRLGKEQHHRQQEEVEQLPTTPPPPEPRAVEPPPEEHTPSAPSQLSRLSTWARSERPWKEKLLVLGTYVLSYILRILLVAGLIALTVISLQHPAVSLRWWLGALVVGCGLLLIPRTTRPSVWYMFLLAALAWAVSLGIEILYIRDHLDGGNYYRMNTVFKFGLQIWTLFALAAALSLPHTMRGLRRLGEYIVGLVLQTGVIKQAATRIRWRQIGGKVGQGVGVAALISMIVAGLVFPLVGTPSRVANRFPEHPDMTLNGLAFLEMAEFDHDGHHVDLGPEQDAIAWLNEHLSGTPIVLQSGLWFYRTYGVRVAANTGFPTVISSLHANEQHDPTVTSMRDRDVEELFRTPEPMKALQTLAKYRVDYVYVGSIERAYYPANGIAKFRTMGELTPVYDSGSVVIYEVGDIPPIHSYRESIDFSLKIRPATPADNDRSDLPSQSGRERVQEPAGNEDDMSLEELEEVVDADPTNPHRAFALARRYQQQQQYEEAVAILQPAAHEHPEDTALHHMLGDILGHIERYDEAEQAYRRAAIANPTSGNWNKLGQELLEWGRLDKAELALFQAIAIEPVDPAAHYHLGKLYVQQGEAEKARKHLLLYQEFAPDGRFAEDAQKTIDQLADE